MASASIHVARSSITTGTHFVTISAPYTIWTCTIAKHTCPAMFTYAETCCRITFQCVGCCTGTLLSTIGTKTTIWAWFITAQPFISGFALAFTSHVITGSIVAAMAHITTVHAIQFAWTLFFAHMTPPAWSTDTVTKIRKASAIIFACTFLGTPYAVCPFFTHLFTLFTRPTRGTGAHPCYRITIPTIFTLACMSTFLSIEWCWAWLVTLISFKSTVTFAPSCSRMTPFRILPITNTRVRTIDTIGYW